MLPKTGDYVIATVNSEKPKLIKVTSITKKGIISGLLNDGPSEENNDTPIRLIENDIWANLGSKPRNGNAFGVKVEPYLRSINSPFGRIDFYRQLTKTERRILMSGLKSIWKKVKNTRIAELFPLNRIEIRPAKGKQAGCYKHLKTSFLSSNNDWIILNPAFIDREMIQYFIWHEIAHGIWFHLVSPSVKARWMSAYSKRMSLHKMKENVLVELRREVESSSSIAEYLQDNDDTVLFKEVLKHIKRVHRLSKENIDVLINQDQSLEKYWPSYYELGEPNTIDVSEYATKSVEEFFAEVVAWSKTGRKMPASIRKLYVRTLSNL